MVAPVAMKHAPIEVKGFEKYDVDGLVIGYMSVVELQTKMLPYVQDSNDGRYFVIAWALSDLENDVSRVKGFANANGITLGGSDFTQTADNLFWVLNPSEWQEFKQVNPMFAEVV